MILTFRDYQSYNVNFSELGELNESHQYSDAVASVMDKLTFFVKRNAALENSNLNESAKRVYHKDIRLNRDERIAAACIFNEMLKQYEENMKEDLSVYEAIINKESVLEEGVEYDEKTLCEVLSLNEEIKIFRKLSNVTKTIISGAKDLTVKSIEVVKATKDDLVDWAKEAKKDLEDKYMALKELVNNIVKKGIDSIEKFINKILEAFTSIGDNLVDAVKKFGGLKMDKDEKPATLDLEDTEGLYKNASNDAEKSFINNVILRAEAIISKDKENASKLMNESYIEESVVDNKFIAWLAGYKSDGTKMSWWKCILIGLCASLVVWLLPKVLVLAGLGGALAAFIAALVGVIWNGLGMLKLIYRRNKERKPGEKFFDRKTSIFFALSLISNVFSIATFIKTIGPLMREICITMEWTGGDDMSAFGKWFYERTKSINPNKAFQDGGFKELSEEVKNYGADVRSNDLIASSEAAVKTMKDMPGASEANVSAFKKFLDAVKDAKGSRAVYEAWKEFIHDPNLQFTAVFDTSKWGGSGPIIKAIDQLKTEGLISDSAIIGTAGSELTQKASKGLYGFVNYITGVNQEQANMIFQRACEIAGKDMASLQIHTYGAGAIANVITITTTTKGMFDAIAPNVPFLPMVVPFFDKKKWGEYKIRFASATRGSAAYVVDKVEMIKKDDVPEGERSDAFKTLVQLHDNAWAEYQKLFINADGDHEPLEEGIFKKKEDKKEQKIKEPQYIAFYINVDKETGHKGDEPKGNGDSNSEKNENTTGIGVVFDTLTMMCADVCNFNKSVDIRKRPQPYFMKGLLSRLSFRPLKDNDNETKDYIRTTLGQTMKTLVSQNVLYGMGKKYIESKVDGDKVQCTLRKTVVGDDKKKVYPDKALFELGNFTPNELIACLSDKSQNNKVAYDFLDGSFASKVSIKKDGNGDITSKSAVRDSASIENIKYYRVSKKEYESIMTEWENNGKDKGEKKPKFIKGYDKEWYKRASKKLLKENPDKYKRKKLYDFVDIRIVPLLKKGDLYEELIKNDKFKKLLYVKTEKGDVKLNKKALEAIKPYLYRPEKTFAKDDEYQLKKSLKEAGVEGEHLGKWANLFKDEEQIHDTFKDLVEKIWDYFSEHRRDITKNFDLKPNHGKSVPESVEYTLFDSLIEEFFDDDYDDEIEYKYDIQLINEQDNVLSFEDFLIENYNE